MGIIMGPYCANVFNPRAWGDHSSVITLEVMRVVLATGLFAIGVELPPAYLAHHVKGLLSMIVPTMAFGWLIVAGACFPASSSRTPFDSEPDHAWTSLSDSGMCKRDADLDC